MKKGLSLIQVLILLIGAVLGSLIARLTEGVRFLSWLAFGDSFGLSPATVDLGVLSVTFGFHVEITIATILGLILAIVLCRRLR